MNMLLNGYKLTLTALLTGGLVACHDDAPQSQSNPTILTCTTPQVLDTSSNSCVTPKPETPTCKTTEYLANNICQAKTAQTITDLIVPELSIGSSATLNANIDSGLSISYSSKTSDTCTIIDNTVTAKAAGTCEVVATQPGDETHLAAAEVSTSAIMTTVFVAIHTATLTPTVNESTTFSLEGALDQVKRVLFKINDTLYQIVTDVSNAVGTTTMWVVSSFNDFISYTFSTTGSRIINATLIDEIGNEIGKSENVIVNVMEKTTIRSTTHSTFLNETHKVYITGVNIPLTALSFDATNGQCEEIADGTRITELGFYSIYRRLTNALVLECSFNAIGVQKIAIKDVDKDNILIGQINIEVKNNVRVNKVSWSNETNTDIRFGDLIDFTVSGISLYDGISLYVEYCNDIKEIGVGTISQRNYQCIMNDPAGKDTKKMIGIVKDTLKNDILYGGPNNIIEPFNVMISDRSPTIASAILPKTGVLNCGNETSNGLLCTPEALGALYGLNQDAEIQAGQDMSYTLLNNNGDECVKDNVTGLIWEQKTDDGLRSGGGYVWYNSDNANNGGSSGDDYYRSYDKAELSYEVGEICGYRIERCNTQAYIAALNAANYCGYSNWRLPSRMELVSLVDYSQYKYVINPIFKFQSNRFWSSSPYKGHTGSAWVLYLDGRMQTEDKTDLGSILAVHDPQ